MGSEADGEERRKPAKKKVARPSRGREARSERDVPPSPRSLPPGFLTTPLAYRARVVGVLLGLLVFVALYAVLIALAVEALLGLWSLDVGVSRGSVYLLLGGSVALGAVIVFLVKGLFRSAPPRPTDPIELERSDEPALFSFIERLVAETGAPTPARVFVSGAVNAAVFYEPSLLSLVWPVRKNLLLGLGLVNHLTRSELKAILAHELGHFSQSSMKLGSYVYIAHGVVRGLVDRDWFDDMLEEGKRSDGRIALVAIIIQGFVWVIRTILRGAFGVLVFGHRALGRDMEFAADRVAVSVTGSDAIARGLYKAELADACAAAAARALTHAGDHGLYTSDFFYHQERIVPEVRRAAERPDWGQIPSGQARLLFEEDTTSKPSMWATHPPSTERERSAKAELVECEHDERPAWTFFSDPEELRARVTASMRPQGAKKIEPSAAEDVEHFLERERSEGRALERFGEMFTGRPLKKLDLAAVFDEEVQSTKQEVEAAAAAIPMAEIGELSARVRELRKEAQLLNRARAGAVREEALRFRGKQIGKGDVGGALARLESEMKELDERFEQIDETLVGAHAKMARSLAPERATTLRRRYALILRLQTGLSAVRAAHVRVLPYFAKMSGGAQLDDAEAQRFFGAVEALRNELADVLARAEGRKLPAMENVAAGTDLATFLLPRPMQPPKPDPALAGRWIGRVLDDAAEVTDKLERLHKKSIAGMVAMFEAIAADWRARDEHPVTEAHESPTGDDTDDTLGQARE